MLAFGILVLLTLSIAPDFQVHQHDTSSHAPVYPDTITAAGSSSPVTGSTDPHPISGNTTATNLTISYGTTFVGNDTKAWAVQYLNLSSWNGTINSRVRAGLYFIPGFTGSSDTSVGTVWANITYGNKTASWTHVYNFLASGYPVYNYTALAPEWNISAPFSGEVIFNLTSTCDPGYGWANPAGDHPQVLTSYAPPNGTNGVDSANYYNDLYGGGHNPPPGGPIPFSWGYLELSYATPVASLNAVDESGNKNQSRSDPGIDRAVPG